MSDRYSVTVREKSRMKHCLGCTSDYYNGKNKYGIKKCRWLKGMDLVKRREVKINAVLPYTEKPKKFPDCYEREGYAYIPIDNDN